MHPQARLRLLHVIANQCMGPHEGAPFVGRLAARERCSPAGLWPAESMADFGATRCGNPHPLPTVSSVTPPLQPQARIHLLHVIARSGAAAPRRGNPRPRRGAWQVGTASGKFVYAFPYLPEVLPDCYALLRGDGLPRRFAPRNDMQKYAACTHGNYVVPGQIRYAFRIRQGHCRAAPSPLSAHSPPGESVTQQCAEAQKTGKAPR